MNLLEYQAKDLFREVGIPVLPSQRINSPKDLKGLAIPYPVVLKSQVPIGGRSLAGGVRFVENTIDAIAVAQSLFNLSIMGEYPSLLLAEAKYQTEQEFYLGIILNRSIRRPVLLGSQQGGINVQSAIDQMHHVTVDQEFSPYYARRLAVKMQLEGNLIEVVSDVLERMYRLFDQHDLDLVEINPLAISPSGEVMALDGKISINDDALARHPQLAQVLTSPDYTPRKVGTPVVVSEEGSIGIICNGAGLTMATMDLVVRAGGKPTAVIDLGGEVYPSEASVPMSQRFERALDAMAQIPTVQILLVNLISSLIPCDDLVNVLISHPRWQQSTSRLGNYTNGETAIPVLRSPRSELPTVVARLNGYGSDSARELLAAARIPSPERLDDAVAQAVSLSAIEQTS
jgi:succinyl-CoA synthetase beta subunit